MNAEAVSQIYQDGVVNVGAYNKSAITRFANICQELQKGGVKPKSPFIEMVADRLLGVSKQDFQMLISGNRGSGKSYTALAIACNLAEEMARRTGKQASDFFTLKQCCVLEDSEGINAILQAAKTNQIIIIDDSSLQYNSRAHQEKKSRNFMALIIVCRTMRWAVIYTSPLRSMVDLNIRQMCQFYGLIYKSFHAGGWNCVKVFSVDVSEQGKNEVFNRRLSLGKDKKKIDFYCCYAPDAKLAEAYDKQRDLSASRIVAAGGDMSKKQAPQCRADKRKGIVDDIRKQKIKPVFAQLAKKHGVDQRTVKRLYEKTLAEGK